MLYKLELCVYFNPMVAFQLKYLQLDFLKQCVRWFDLNNSSDDNLKAEQI